MPPKKRQASQPPAGRRNRRRSPDNIPNVTSSPLSPQLGLLLSPGNRTSPGSKRRKTTSHQIKQRKRIDVMHTITHHTSFIPAIAQLQLMHNSHQFGRSNQSTITYNGLTGSTISSTISQTNSRKSKKAASNATQKMSMEITTADRPYALYHARNLGLKPPTITTPPEGEGKVLIPHSAGCRMKYLPEPTFRTLPVHPEYQSCTNMGPTCPTVLNTFRSNTGQIAMGDTGGFVTLYATLPTFLPVTKLSTSASNRFVESTSFVQKKRVGRSQAVVGSSIDRSNAIETICILPRAQSVVVATRLEVECISFDNHIVWSNSCFEEEVTEENEQECEELLAWDGLEEEKMMRGIPYRMVGNEENDSILASYIFYPYKDQNKSDQNDSGDDEADTESNQPKDQDLRPSLHSPVLKIDTKTGRYSNVVPMEETSTGELVECKVGDRALAIFDRYQEGNILALFMTKNEQNELRQELFVLDPQQKIVERTTIPTKKSGPKTVSVEAMDQSPHGDYTVVANAKGGVRIYKTEGLHYLGAYGEGVSLHGHTIIWQDVFFARFDADRNMNNKQLTNDDSQEQWGNILERKDELVHRREYEGIREKKKDSLDELYIVSVPSAFREPQDMREHIQFWDVSKVEFDGGSKLPCFELLAPKKAEGICSLIYDDSIKTSNSGRFFLSTHAGDCLEMTPTLVSDWCGQMYPSGYLVIDNNITYIEDEDELDQVIDGPLNQDEMCQPIGQKTTDDEELKFALQMSMQDELVDIIGNSDADTFESIIEIAPCRPEPHLKVVSANKKDNKEDTEGNDDMRIDEAKTGFDLMKMLPSYKSAIAHSKKSESADAERKILLEETRATVDEPPPKIPRKKQGNIDAIINSKVNKRLTVKILEKMSRSNGAGSHLVLEGKETPVMTDETSTGKESTAKESQPEKKFCAACQGRLVIHTCGKRAAPIDYDAIARAEREKKEAAAAEKKRIKEEKRKLAEEKRKAKKKKQKEEEERARQEEIARQKMNEEEINTEALLSLRSREVEEPQLDLTTDQSPPTNHKTDSSFQYEEIQYDSSHSRVHHYNSFNSSHQSDSNYQYNTFSYGNNSTSQYTQSHPSAYQYDYQHGSQQPEQKNDTVREPPANTSSYGDPMLSNIPSLPSEPPSSYYQQNRHP